MSAPPLRILVLDGATMDRLVTCRELAKDPQLVIVGSASDWRLGAKLLRTSPPDWIVCDPTAGPELEFSLELVHELHAIAPGTPCVLFSKPDATQTVGFQEIEKLLAAYVPKALPGEGLVDAITRLRSHLVSAPATGTLRTSPQRVIEQTLPLVHRGPIEILAVGSSTGGPDALERLLLDISPEVHVPIVITQHMPENFTAQLARRLDQNTPWRVLEGEDGMVLKPGVACLAPGGRHMLFRKSGPSTLVQLDLGEKENFCRPAVDPMFRSAAEHYGARVLAVILTGMGSDGTLGAQAIHGLGGRVVVQDKESSVVWGMPRFAFEAGVTEATVALQNLGAHVSNIVQSSRRPSRVSQSLPPHAA